MYGVRWQGPWRRYSRVTHALAQTTFACQVAGRAYGTTSLVAAAQHGHEDVVRILLEGGADPHKTLNDGSTALQKSQEQRHTAIVERLLESMQVS